MRTYCFYPLKAQSRNSETLAEVSASRLAMRQLWKVVAGAEQGGSLGRVSKEQSAR